MLLLKDTSRIEVLADGEISAVEVDFELYATGVKNLIDNALRFIHHNAIHIELFSIHYFQSYRQLNQ